MSSGNTEVAVIRKGKRVFVGDPKGVGMWFDHVNAQLARVTEESLKTRLSRGWPGTLEMLMDVVNQDLERNAARHRQRRKAHEAAMRAAERRVRGSRLRRW